MDIFNLPSYIDISLNVHKTLLELENLNKRWSIDASKLKKPYGRVPGEKEIMLWSIPRNSIKLITFLAIMNKSKVIIDAGTSVGYSALWLSVAAKLNGGKVYTIDNFYKKIKLKCKWGRVLILEL